MSEKVNFDAYKSAKDTISTGKKTVKATYKAGKTAFKVSKNTVNIARSLNKPKTTNVSTLGKSAGNTIKNVGKVKKRLKRNPLTKSVALGVSQIKNVSSTEQFEQADESAKAAHDTMRKSAQYGKKAYLKAVKTGYKGGKWTLKKTGKYLKRSLAFTKDIPVIGGLIRKTGNMLGTVLRGVQLIVGQVISFIATFLGLILPIFIVVFFITCFFTMMYQMNEEQGVGDLDGVEREVATALYAEGFSKATVAGIMGNIKAECDFRYNVQEDISSWSSYNYEVNYGLFQFTDAGSSASNLNGCAELTKFKRWCAEHKTKMDTVTAQIEFQFAESGGYGIKSKIRSGIYNVSMYQPYNLWGYSYISDYNQFKRMNDPGHAAYVFMIGGETPAAQSCHLDKRVQYAREYFRRMEGGDLPVVTGSRAAVIEAAKSQLGVPYIYGAYVPGTCFDCSGFTKYCYSKAGITLPHSAAAQMALLRPVPRDKIQPGDLIFWIGNVAASESGNHVAIYAGNGMVYHANGRCVTYSPLKGGWVAAATGF